MAWLCERCSGAAELVTLSDGRKRPRCGKCAPATTIGRVVCSETLPPIMCAVDASKDAIRAVWPDPAGCVGAPPTVHGDLTTSLSPGYLVARSVQGDIRPADAAARGDAVRMGLAGACLSGQTPGPPAFRIGQWVRFVSRGKYGAEAAKMHLGSLGEVCGVNGTAVTVVAPSNVAGPGTCTGAYMWDFDQIEPAVPRKGEWWQKLHCGAHPGFDRNPSDTYIGHADLAACGCLRPVNFGKGDTKAPGAGLVEKISAFIDEGEMVDRGVCPACANPEKPFVHSFGCGRHF